MKKLLIFLSMLTLLISYATAIGIQVYKPAKNEIIYKGADFTIRWNIIGTTKGNVKISLLNKSAVKILDIIPSTTNSGQFLWKKHQIDGIKEGSYYIQVKYLSINVGGNSGLFTIKNKKEPNIGLIQVETIKYLGLVIQNPQRNVHWKTGKSYTIRWIKPAKIGSKVRISYFPKGQSNLVKAGQDTVIARSAPNSGSFLWKISPIARTGNVQIHIRTTDKKYKADSQPFFIDSPGKPRRHRAPAIGAPSGASFSIKRIMVNYFSPGVIDKVVVQVEYKSKTAFSFDKYKGHPKDGPVYLNCKIINPIWPEDKTYSFKPAAKGPPIPKVIYNHRLSIKYSGKQHLDYAPKIMNPGHGVIDLVFSAKHSGKLRGLHTMKNMAGAIATTPDVCRRYYSPKILIRAFFHTKEGTKVSFKQSYLNNAPQHMFKIPGKVNICTGGYVSW